MVQAVELEPRIEGAKLWCGVRVRVRVHGCINQEERRERRWTNRPCCELGSMSKCVAHDLKNDFKILRAMFTKSAGTKPQLTTK